MNQYINQLAHPWFLLLLALVPVFLWLQIRAESRRTPTVVYSDLSLAAGIRPTLRQRLLKLLPWSRAIVLTLGIIALARPQYGRTEVSMSSLGLDIAMVIDVSGSMMEEDYYPNRLEAAKEAAISFVRMRETDRVSVVIFGAVAALLAPPTLDMPAVEQFIASIQREIIDGSATAIGDGLGLAVTKLKDSPAKSRVVILLTDGDNNSGRLSPEQAAAAAKAHGIKVYTIGVTRGTRGRQGLNLFGAAPFSSQMLGLSEEVLKGIAESTGGKYFRASNESTLKSIYTEIDRLEKSEIEVTRNTDFDERFHFFWFPALALLALEFLLRALVLRRLP